MKKPGGPQGIRSGVYYVRKPGPESAPVLGAEDWDPIIRRCVLNDRDRLLSDFSVLMQRSERRRVEGPGRLPEWHRGSEERFLELLPGDIGARWPVSIKEHRYQLSYLISTDGGELLEMGRVSEILQRINLEVRNTVWTGWSMFFPFSGSDVAPRVYAENRDGSGGDVLECDLMRISDLDYSLPDYWRLAPDGRVTLLRAYREDRRRSNAVPGRESGTWLSPETVIRETTELVTHARLLARYFPTASRIAFGAPGWACRGGDSRTSTGRFIGVPPMWRQRIVARRKGNGRWPRWRPTGAGSLRNCVLRCCIFSISRDATRHSLKGWHQNLSSYSRSKMTCGPAGCAAGSSGHSAGYLPSASAAAIRCVRNETTSHPPGSPSESCSSTTSAHGRSA